MSIAGTSITETPAIDIPNVTPRVCGRYLGSRVREGDPIEGHDAR